MVDHRAEDKEGKVCFDFHHMTNESDGGDDEWFED